MSSWARAASAAERPLARVTAGSRLNVDCTLSTIYVSARAGVKIARRFGDV
jgi:hypothetical protein